MELQKRAVPCSPETGAIQLATGLGGQVSIFSDGIVLVVLHINNLSLRQSHSYNLPKPGNKPQLPVQRQKRLGALKCSLYAALSVEEIHLPSSREKYSS